MKTCTWGDVVFAIRSENQGIPWLDRMGYKASEMLATELPDWEIKATQSSDGLTMHGCHRILYGVMQSASNAYRLLLHEVAHARMPKPVRCPGHTLAWWTEYARLLSEWHPTGVPSRSDLIALAVCQDWKLLELREVSP